MQVTEVPPLDAEATQLLDTLATSFTVQQAAQVKTVRLCVMATMR